MRFLAKHHDDIPRKPTYGIIGNGRVASHLSHYFALKKIPVVQWHKQSQKTVKQSMSDVDIILLAISDKAIDSFSQRIPICNKKFAFISQVLRPANLLGVVIPP